VRFLLPAPLPAPNPTLLLLRPLYHQPQMIPLEPANRRFTLLPRLVRRPPIAYSGSLGYCVGLPSDGVLGFGRFTSWSLGRGGSWGVVDTIVGNNNCAALRFHKNPSFLEPRRIPRPVVDFLHHPSSTTLKAAKSRKCLNHLAIISTL